MRLTSATGATIDSAIDHEVRDFLDPFDFLENDEIRDLVLNLQLAVSAAIRKSPAC